MWISVAWLSVPPWLIYKRCCSSFPSSYMSNTLFFWTIRSNPFFLSSFITCHHLLMSSEFSALLIFWLTFKVNHSIICVLHTIRPSCYCYYYLSGNNVVRFLHICTSKVILSNLISTQVVSERAPSLLHLFLFWNLIVFTNFTLHYILRIISFNILCNKFRKLLNNVTAMFHGIETNHSNCNISVANVSSPNEQRFVQVLQKTILFSFLYFYSQNNYVSTVRKYFSVNYL